MTGSADPVLLPAMLRPAKVDDLVRLGRSGDGGYLLRRSDLERTRGVVGLGLGPDWSFEAEAHAETGAPVRIYDGTVSLGRLARRAAASVLVLRRRRHLGARLARIWSYLRFFRGASCVHHRRNVGPVAGNVSLAETLEGMPEPILLKIDIEGGEYRLLDEIVAQAERLSALVIEFHDIDLHAARIAGFLDALPLRLVHVHVNNAARPLADGRPRGVECTLSPGPAGPGAGEVPHPLDRPNSARGWHRAVRFEGAGPMRGDGT